MQRLLQSVAKAIARQARGLLEQKAPVRESTRAWSEPQGRRNVGFRARAAPVAAAQKSAKISWPLGVSRRGLPNCARRLRAILEISDGSRTPVAPTSITVFATISAIASLRSTKCSDRNTSL